MEVHSTGALHWSIEKLKIAWNIKKQCMYGEGKIIDIYIYFFPASARLSEKWGWEVWILVRKCP